MYYSASKKDHYYTTSRDLSAYDDWHYEDFHFKAFNTQTTGSVPVYAFYNGNNDHAFSTNPNEATTNGWHNEGVSFYAYDTPVQGSVPIYEFYNSNDSDHAYSADPNYTINYPGWNFRGIKFYALPINPVTINYNPVSVHTYYSSAGGDHYLTSSRALDNNSLWEYQGESFKAYSSQINGSIPVYEFYNGLSDHAFSTNINEATTNGWSNKGISFYAYQTQVSGTVPIYEWYNANNTDHVYSANPTFLGPNNNGWVFKGIKFYAFAEVSNSSSSALPVNFYYAPNGKDHYLTLSRDLDYNSHWTYLGVQFKAYNNQVTGSIPVYGFYNGQSDHAFSPNPNEAITNGWRNEGISFFAFNYQVPGTVPIYEWYNSSSTDHAYSSDPNYVANYSGWSYKGIKFYAYP